MLKKVSQFNVIQHGIEHSQYFQGAGISHTRFTDIATGCGFTEKEALENAIEMLAENDWNTETLEEDEDFQEEVCNISDDNPTTKDDTFYYLSILVA